jgi:BirA family transcriptional regulator, biotin operon repressor / biotin---[acetyl-CoA-carboxylase] ligase
MRLRPDAAVPEQDQERRILEVFLARPGKVVSGEELRVLLGVSRTSVWKHINNLRRQGVDLSTVPARGYRLEPDGERLVPAAIAAGITPRRLGCRILCWTETGSTNLEASRLAEEGAPEGTVVIADSQSGGKGRLGRQWVSPPGVNLYCSVILRPKISPLAASQLTFLSAVAVARAITACTRLSPRIKWPNDILINGCKVAGLLNELSAETDRIKYVVLGIGVNLNMTSDQFPEDLRSPATSLYLAGGERVNRVYFVQNLLKELDDLYDTYLMDGYASIRSAWLQQSCVLGRRVQVDVGGGQVYAGMVTGLDEQGALLVRRDDGFDERILAGDVKLLEEEGLGAAGN